MSTPAPMNDGSTHDGRGAGGVGGEGEGEGEGCGPGDGAGVAQELHMEGHPARTLSPSTGSRQSAGKNFVLHCGASGLPSQRSQFAPDHQLALQLEQVPWPLTPEELVPCAHVHGEQEAPKWAASQSSQSTPTQ